MAAKFYVVKSNELNTIVNTWEEAKKAMEGKTNISQKSFSSYEDALAFLNGKEESLSYENPTAYIDGSFDINTKCYSFGGVLILKEKVYQFNKKYEPDNYSDLRNVAGEIKGAGFIINYAIKHDIKVLDIYYDYLGIEKWYKGEWKANSSIAIEYQKFAEVAKTKIEVIFHKVKSHTNNKYNDMADHLAKEALGI